MALIEPLWPHVRGERPQPQPARPPPLGQLDKPGAEPAAEFTDRVRAAIGRVAAAHTGQRVAVFTHGGVIGQVLALASGSRPFAFVTSDNGSISRLVVAGPRWFVRGFNDTAHLEQPWD